jgi:hypothetical protein
MKFRLHRASLNSTPHQASLSEEQHSQQSFKPQPPYQSTGSSRLTCLSRPTTGITSTTLRPNSQLPHLSHLQLLELHSLGDMSIVLYASHPKHQSPRGMMCQRSMGYSDRLPNRYRGNAYANRYRSNNSINRITVVTNRRWLRCHSVND